MRATAEIGRDGIEDGVFTHGLGSNGVIIAASGALAIVVGFAAITLIALGTTIIGFATVSAASIGIVSAGLFSRIGRIRIARVVIVTA